MTKTHSNPSPAAFGGMSAEEIRKIVESGKKRGLIGATAKGCGPQVASVDKAGLDVAQFLGKAQAKWVDVTPAKSAAWLKNNFVNRPVKEDVIVAYARDMMAGQWVPTHQGIAFNDQDALIDGQHRLLAVVMSGVTVRMMVTFGLPSKIAGREMTTMDCVDRGRTRSVADQLVIQHGFKYGSLTASICAALASLCCGERTRRLSVGQTLEVFREFEQGVQFVIEHRSKEHGLKTAGVLAGFAFALAVDGNPVSHMFTAMNSGDGLTPTLKLLRDFLTSDEAKLFSRSLDRGLAELTLQAIHLVGIGQEVTKLEMSLDGVNHYRAAQAKRVEKIAGLFKLPAKAEPPRPDPKPEPSPAAAVGPATAPKVKRPSLDIILAAAEVHYKIARCIFLARGNDADQTEARTVIVAIARGFGYTAEQIAPALRRTPEQIAALDVGADALTGKQRKAVETLKGRLGLV